jgi:hypothetical protein
MISSLRLHNQQIENSTFKTPAEVVSWLGALQGQDYAGTKWAVGLRIPGSTEADIERAIAAHSIVRTWAMRGTLFFVAPADVRWIVGLVGAQHIAGSARRYRELELDETTLARSDTILAKALAGSAGRTRSDLFAMLEQNGISTQGQRGYHMLVHAALNGLIYQTTAERGDPVFHLVDDLTPAPSTLPHDAALAELVTRYFTSRGPATVQDFVHWTGMRVGDAKAGFEAVKAQLVCETIDGQDYWLSPTAAPEPTPAPAGTVHLLPGFDEYLLG